MWTQAQSQGDFILLSGIKTASFWMAIKFQGIKLIDWLFQHMNLDRSTWSRYEADYCKF